jgi:adenosylmethionine-8-amino-7-oxononanoate aminotransferase
VTSGYQPLGGVLVGRRVREPLEADPELVLRHGHTYSGHPASCVAAEVVLDILHDEELLDAAEAIGSQLAAGLRSIDGLAEVRGDGAVWAAGLPDGVDAQAVRDGMLRRGVIARHLGPSTIAFCPPLVITDEELDRCVSALDEALAEQVRASR